MILTSKYAFQVSFEATFKFLRQYTRDFDVNFCFPTEFLTF